ncbi:ABC transporter ATP-binding protein [Megasphaera sp.]|uniref:ABC transporter ATP-binding protein n=1 Tax=Megasphaera sp. TaxID=2023260 RepID=UPI0025BBFB0A|nr:ABC transporter ATP-binding protein [Megasphaera sp.]MCF0152222.1 ABC transporter ATP-binding protein [Megasphaera sp.]
MADAITVQHLVVRRGRRTILHDFSAALPKGKVTAIIGPNGCGKSTFLKAVNCLIPAAGGSICLGSRDVHDFSRKALSREMAFLSQTHDLPPDVTVRDLVGMGRYPYRHLWSGRSREDREAVEKAIQAVGLEACAGIVMQHLSGGEQQRAWLAVLLAQDAPILLLDEPTTYLDVHHQLRILDLLRRINERWQKTIVVVLHDMNQAWQYADEVVIMKDGRLVCAGPPQDVLTPERLWDVFAVHVDIVTTSDGQSAIVPLQT